MGNFKKVSIYLIPILLILGVFIFLLDKMKDTSFKLFGLGKDNVTSIDKAIILLDASFDMFGTDFDTIKKVVDSLNGSQLIELHKTFGSRLYHKLLGRYATGFFYPNIVLKDSVSEELDLNGLYATELTSKEFNIIEEIYKSKGVDFPLL